MWNMIADCVNVPYVGVERDMIASFLARHIGVMHAGIRFPSPLGRGYRTNCNYSGNHLFDSRWENAFGE